MTANATDGTIHVIAELHATPGNEGALRELLLAVAAKGRTEKGCSRYEIFEETKKPGSFTSQEVWASEADLAAHLKSVGPDVMKAKALIEGEVKITPYKKI